MAHGPELHASRRVFPELQASERLHAAAAGGVDMDMEAQVAKAIRSELDRQAEQTLN